LATNIKDRKILMILKSDCLQKRKVRRENARNKSNPVTGLDRP
jgi:hypothetical protein